MQYINQLKKQINHKQHTKGSYDSLSGIIREFIDPHGAIN